MEEYIKLTMKASLFQTLFKDGHIKSGEYELHDIIIPEFDYSDSEKWQQAKKESTKAYKALKQLEFNLRNNKQN